jgi:hypothetical protein
VGGLAPHSLIASVSKSRWTRTLVAAAYNLIRIAKFSRPPSCARPKNYETE